MHFHLLQHSPHQGPARIADWLDSMGHSHTVFHLHDGELTPRLADADGLIVLDGPDEGQVDPQATWPRDENKLIDRALDGRKPLLGVGYGARRIAEALGAVVSRGTHAASGWHSVRLAPQSPFDLPETFEAFMWHRDIFALPDDALPLGGSEAGPMQGFSWDAQRVIGLLFHIEATPASAAAMLDHLPALGGGPYVQSRRAMLADTRRFDRQAPLLDRLLAQWLASVRR
ncbi:type 1 glutamine amidotransferase [Halomonas sabkhae]|uniref:type 1 glutamine amidotransferase n=1 Tax=Halomonas sabkhae TaxID=626223 RepID=UPI0025B44F0D|nr:type 1 glutamine amidotransferase [Halomonas sabkhae]MDN3525256.1 type 1 glutamine amidotransferase [Halomonas sabkhae]